jgi:large subunit ribosomal protein L23
MSAAKKTETANPEAKSKKKASASKASSKKKDAAAANVKPYLYDILDTPVITEKSQAGVEHNKITFRVSIDATKQSVKDAVEALFEVKVEKVNIINAKGKTKRFRGLNGKRKDIKKAVVTLAEGQDIDVVSVA